MTLRSLYAAVIVSALASAHPLTIVFSGTTTGSIGAVQFSNANFTITFTSDTNNLASPPCCAEDLATPAGTPATISVAGVNANFTDNQSVFVNSSEDDIGIWHPGGPDFLTMGNPAFATYNVGKSFGPVGGTTFVLGGSFSTSKGVLSMSSVNNVTFQATVTGTSPWRIVGAGDFNRDGNMDMVWQDPNTGAVQLYFMDGTQNGSVTGFANVTSGNTWRVVGVADFNRDGIPDLLWQDPASGATQVWFMGGALGNTLSGYAGVSNPNAWRIVAVADFNRDGAPDLVWQDTHSSAASQVWYMGGPQGVTLQSFATLTGPNAWRIVGVGDFNKDGIPDLVWQDTQVGPSQYAQNSGQSQVWFMGGTLGTTLAGFAGITGPHSWRIVAVADFDKSGNADLVWQDINVGPTSVDLGTGTAQVWYMGGAQGATLVAFAGVNPTVTSAIQPLK